MSPLPASAGTRRGVPFTVPFPRPRPTPLDVHPADCPACRAGGRPDEPPPLQEHRP